MSIYEKLVGIQLEIKCPKTQFNSFGKYYYRSCEDILEGLKPVIGKYGCCIIISDSVKQIGDRYYIQASATLIDSETGESISNSAYAREDDNKKGADSSQVTGTASSYARKYALNGLFGIDDTKDSDSTNTHGKTDASESSKQSNAAKISDSQQKRIFAIAKGNTDIAKEIVTKYGFASSKDITVDKYKAICEEIEKRV